MRRKRQPSRPTTFAWFFGYFTFDLLRVKSLALSRPYAMLKPGTFDVLLEDGVIDLDVARTVAPEGVGTLGVIPLPDGHWRPLLLDGYEIALRCSRDSRPLRLRVLSRAETRSCLIPERSTGEWRHE